MKIRWEHVRAAAGLNAAFAVMTLGVAVWLIGLGAMFDRERFLRMAVENPGPILLQDGLKLPSALASLLLVGAFRSGLHPENPGRVHLATGAGVLAAVALLLNAALSSYGVLNAGRLSGDVGTRINAVVGALALLVLLSSGVWYWLINLTALRAGALPKGLCRLGIAVGVMNLLPPLALPALVLSIAWSSGVALTASRREPAAS